jgi:hypothetical protein
MRLKFKDRRAFERRGNDFLDFARSYLSEAFPNPDRQGCPPDPALRSLAFNPTEGEPAVTQHLAFCSPCFRRYSELLAELKSQQQAAESPWSRIYLWSRAHLVLAATALACALFTAIGVSLLLRGIRQPSAPPIETNRKPSPTQPVNPNVAYLPFSLDLSRLSFPVRGSESAPTGTKQRVLVPNSRLNLTLTLPFASPEGRYEVKLAAGGQTFWSKSAQAHLQEGKTLIQVEADFTKIQAGNYNLEVRSLSGIRLIQPVSIQPPLLHSGEQKP